MRGQGGEKEKEDGRRVREEERGEEEEEERGKGGLPPGRWSSSIHVNYLHFPATFNQV